MTTIKLIPTLLITVLALTACQSSSKKKAPPSSQSQTVPPLIKNKRQLTFAGRRSGEAYYSQNGDWIIFQSERESDNPFYQIYAMNLKTGKTHRVSPGFGKTTCSWIHPGHKKVLFSSTHQDPKAREKQKAELDFRASGKKRRYSWDYDENYDIFESTLYGRRLKNLTHSKGYDAEGSYSPDGKWIAFSSNRHAYTEKLSPDDKKRFERDPSYMLDIYIMRADGSQVRRLTHHKGYDGGPFFSPDGQRIVWRQFNKEGHQAEVYTMKLDGSDKKQITHLNAMSWAPFYHPSGDYIIFTTNLLGYHNFELYIVDSEGKRDPIRVTDIKGFDGLPVFAPSGDQLVWSSPALSGSSQVFMADWDDSLARQLLKLSPKAPKKNQLKPEIDFSDIKKWITYLSSEALQGRLTGSPGEKAYTDSISQFFKELKLKPAGTNSSYIQKFPFVSGVDLGGKNSAKISQPQMPLSLGRDWTPLSFSKTGNFKPAAISFVGYGIVAPAVKDQKPYDSYQGLDVTDRWVMMFRYIPEDLSPEERTHLQRYSRLHHKVMIARNRGAKGVLFVSGPNSGVKNQLIPLKKDSLSSSGQLPVLSISDSVAIQLLGAQQHQSAQLSLKELQSKLDKTSQPLSFHLKGPSLSAQIDVKHNQSWGRNTLGLLQFPGAQGVIIVGAHGDHLGVGLSESSLITNKDSSQIHYGADDNASGVSGVLEIAHWLNDQKKKGLKLRQNVLFAIWSGEELGNIGSSYFAKQLRQPQTQRKSSTPSKSMAPLWKGQKVKAFVNMDMIGRLKDHLYVQGLGSSPDWSPLLERARFQNPQVPIVTQEDPYLPTDSMALYLAGVPVINFFTGPHKDYHTPRDTADKINWQGTQSIVQFVSSITTQLGSESHLLKYEKAKRITGSSTRGGFRIFLGTIPDYAAEKVKGVKLSGVIKGGPAEKAGLREGDVIVQFSKFKIENIYDYVYSLEASKPGKTTQIVVLRNNQKLNLDITPEAKQ